ncbi:hypothetical protein FB451DRAFT_1388576 [Mycena latifolia]|nr:hypothetical protein FB451DRAFT_1388576 [Mycena latifolia]
MILPFRIQCFLFNNFEAAKLDDLQAAGFLTKSNCIRYVPCSERGVILIACDSATWSVHAFLDAVSHSALFNTATPDTYKLSPSTVSTGLSEARGTGSMLVVEGGERLALHAVRVTRALPVASSNDEPATWVPEPLWATGSDAAYPTVEERARLVSQHIGARSSMLAGSCRRGGVVPHTQQPGVDMGRTTVENVPDLFRGAPWGVVADSPDRQPLRTCLLKSLKIPGGGLATLVHPRRGPPGLIPSGQLIAR